MIFANFSNKVLTIGCHCNPPRGGIAYVLKTYQDNIYSPFKFVANSKGNFFVNIWYLVKAYIHCEWLYLTDKDIEIVHIHTASYISFKRSSWFMHQAKRYKKKVIAHIHGGGFKEYYKKETSFVEKELHKFDAVVALSETWKTFFESIGCKRVFIINNIIEPPIVLPAITDTKFHFLFLGLITEAKGIFDLMEVIKDNHNLWKGKALFYIGGNGQVEKLLHYIKENDLSDIVQYEGWVSGRRKQELLCSADAFILPSYAEGMPISIMEAMSYGLTILTTPVGGIPEIIQDGVNGYFIEAGNKGSISKAICRVLEEDDNQIGKENAQCTVQFLPPSIEDELTKMYEALCE